jgi:hypothetical protein
MQRPHSVHAVSAKINFIVYPVTFRGFYPKIGVIFGKNVSWFLGEFGKYFALLEHETSSSGFSIKCSVIMHES